MPAPSTRAFAWAQKTHFLPQKSFMAKCAHPVVFFQILYSRGWLFAGGPPCRVGLMRQDPSALGAGTGDGMMQGSGKQEPCISAGSSVLAPGASVGQG